MNFEGIKSNEKLEQILMNFIDVLRINILIVDPKGKPVLVPQTTSHGFYGATQWGVLKNLGKPEFLSAFQIEGNYLKAVDIFGFQSFAIPISIGASDEIGYMIVGPVVLYNQLEEGLYRSIAKDEAVNYTDFLECLSEVRIVTFNALKSILDLLSELSRYALRMKDKETVPEIRAPGPVRLANAIFINLLDLAMTLTQAECGSVMLLNKDAQELYIHTCKGLDLQNFQNVPVKLDESIAGLAIEQKEPFLINGQCSNNRISQLLKKPELKCSLVLPIIANNSEVLGVMNISTRQEASRLATHPQEMMKSLQDITSGTFSKFL